MVTEATMEEPVWEVQPDSAAEEDACGRTVDVGGCEEGLERDDNRQPTQAKETSEGVEKRCHNKELGRRGEEAAVRFLERRGFEVLERNWTCHAGEADIIAQDEDTLVFVEVKTRSNADKGLPEEAVDKHKRERYERIAAAFLQTYDTVDIAVRFDVVSILVIGSERAFLRHHVNAFSVDE